MPPRSVQGFLFGVEGPRSRVQISGVFCHRCRLWEMLADNPDFVMMVLTLMWLFQTCAPEASMCQSPSSIPDSFISFNIPVAFPLHSMLSLQGARC